MKRLFFDAAYIGKLHWVEPGSPEVQALAGTADQIVCSHHGRAEFYSIGFRKMRESLVPPATLRAVFAQFNADISQSAIVLLPLTDTILDRVEAAFANAPATTYLRAADAINCQLKKVFADCELAEETVIRNFRITASDGKTYVTQHCSLAAIMAVGYKVNSEKAVQFRN